MLAPRFFVPKGIFMLGTKNLKSVAEMGKTAKMYLIFYRIRV